MGNRTPLYQQHVDAGARIVDFAGWDMPVQYGSLMAEHNAVRERAGVFDVSHMTVIDIPGPDATAFLRYLLANDVAKLQPDGLKKDELQENGKALYSAMINETGGVVDDLIVYRLEQSRYRLVVNCATREKDLNWIRQHGESFEVAVEEKADLAILAVHGPESVATSCAILDRTTPGIGAAEKVAALKNFTGVWVDDWFVARTGYTGEKGLEFIIPGKDAPALWQELMKAGVEPVGLGARDTLRLEAGMNLYGHEMDETVSPLAANMGQTIAWKPEDRRFVGREALEAARAKQTDGSPVLVGLVLEQRGVLREGLSVVCETPRGEEDGIITSGTFSPTLKHSIALARVPADTSACQVDLRGKLTRVEIVKPGFVRFGRKIF